MRSRRSTQQPQRPASAGHELRPGSCPGVRRGWVATAAQYNPVTAVMEAGRSLIAGDPFHVLLAFGATAGLAALTAIWAQRGLRRAEAEPA